MFCRDGRTCRSCRRSPEFIVPRPVVVRRGGCQGKERGVLGRAVAQRQHGPARLDGRQDEPMVARLDVNGRERPLTGCDVEVERRAASAFRANGATRQRVLKDEERSGKKTPRERGVKHAAIPRAICSMLRDRTSDGELFRERGDRTARRWQPRPQGEGRDSAGGSTHSPRLLRA